MSITPQQADQHIQIFGIVSLVMGAMTLFFGLIATALMPAFMAFPTHGLFPARLFFGGFALFVLAIGVLTIVAGIGALNRRPWTRVIALVASAIALPNIPVGTAYGVYGLYLFTRPEIVARLDEGDAGASTPDKA